jgi:hypothetical protein
MNEENRKVWIDYINADDEHKAQWERWREGIGAIVIAACFAVLVTALFSL